MSDALAAPRPWWTRLPLRNPIFTRELLTILRQPRGFVLLALSLVVSAGAVLTSWPQTPAGIVGQGELSRSIFALFGAAQMLILGLIVPGTLAASISSEKEAETIDLLLTTPLSGDMIVTGKLFSGLGYLLLVGLASLPVLMLCSVIGGLSGQDVLVLYTALVLQGLAYGLTSVACSALSSRTVVAVMVAYLLVAFEAALLVPVADDLAATFVRAATISVIAYVVARKAARAPYNPVPKPPEERDPRRTTGLVLRPDAFPDRFLLPRNRGRELPDTANPIHFKELAAGIHGAGSGFVRILVQLGLALSLVVFLAALIRGAGATTPLRGDWVSYPFLCFVAAFGMILGPAIGARAFSGEREQGTAEMLCLVLLPRSALVLGKFTACMRVVITLTAIVTVPYLGYVLLSLSLFQVCMLALIVVSVGTVGIAVGFLCSLISPTTTLAMFRSYGVLFILWAGPALLPLLFVDPPQSLMTVLSVLTPFHAVDLSLAGRQTVPYLGFACLAAHLLLSATAVAAILRLCASRFDATMRQVSEQ